MLRHVVYASLLQFGVETALAKTGANFKNWGTTHQRE
jgi:hypothetical protein